MSVNVDEYLAGVHRLIRDGFRTNDPSGGMPVATVAYFAKQALGDYTAFGFTKFKEVVQELEKRGLVKTGTDSKEAFSIWLSGPPSVTEQRQPVPRNWEKLRGLKSQVWFAFVSAIPTGRRFLNRRTGEVRLAVSQQLEPADEWVEITAVDPESERVKARQFVSEKMPGDPEIIASVDSPRWYAEFPRLMRQRNPLLASEWSRSRSNRVIEAAKGWCEQNKVDQELVFERGFAGARPAMPNSSRTGEPQLKSLLLSALGALTTEELLRLPIPARQLTAVLRPDLLE